MFDRQQNLNATAVHYRCSPRVSIEAMAKALVVSCRFQVQGNQLELITKMRRQSNGNLYLS